MDKKQPIKVMQVETFYGRLAKLKREINEWLAVNADPTFEVINVDIRPADEEWFIGIVLYAAIKA